MGDRRRLAWHVGGDDLHRNQAVTANESARSQGRGVARFPGDARYISYDFLVDQFESSAKLWVQKLGEATDESGDGAPPSGYTALSDDDSVVCVISNDSRDIFGDDMSEMTVEGICGRASLEAMRPPWRDRLQRRP